MYVNVWVEVEFEHRGEYLNEDKLGILPIKIGILTDPSEFIALLEHIPGVDMDEVMENAAALEDSWAIAEKMLGVLPCT